MQEQKQQIEDHNQLQAEHLYKSDEPQVVINRYNQVKVVSTIKKKREVKNSETPEATA